MAKQMYQIFSAPEFSSDTNFTPELLAIITMEVMKNVFSLHRDAVNRIVRETSENEGRGISSVHFNRRPIPGFGYAVVVARCEQWSAK